MANFKLILALLCLSASAGYRLAAESDAEAAQWTGFKDIKVVEGDWQNATDGTLVNRNGGTAVMGMDNWENYTFEVTCKVPESQAQWPYIGLILRYQNPNKKIVFNISPKEHYYYVTENGNRLDGRRVPFKFGTEHRLKITCVDEEISFSLDGQDIGKVETSGQNYKGKVGFAGYSSTTAIFSDPVITPGNPKEANLKQVAVVDFNEHLTQSYYPGSDSLKADSKDRILSLIGRNTDIPAPADKITVNIKGDGLEHTIGIIVTDNSGEKHFLGKRKIRGTAWKEFIIDLRPFFKAPDPGEIRGTSWGGDANQKIDFPIKMVELGLWDNVRSFEENRGVDIGQVKFFSIQ